MLDRYIGAQDISGARIRVWSLVVTIFGDAIEPRGGVIRLSALQHITERLGIESNALRTAMSRLASDGWLERERIGRASYYRPSKMASLENAKACETIYESPPDDWNRRWVLALSTKSTGFSSNCRNDIHSQNFAFYGRKLALAPDYGKAGNDPWIDDAILVKAEEFRGETISGIVNDIDFHIDCRPFYESFVKSVSILLEDGDAVECLEGADAIALRTLLVHNWRRIVLKDVRWPGKARSKDWPGFEAQRLMSEIYHKLLPASEAWLEGQDCAPGANMPDASAGLLRRFKV